jgi:raffinose/stachyose/melibiose transport system permease protein
MFNRRQPPAIFNHVVLLMLVSFAILPLLVLAFNSVKSRQEFGANPLGPPREIQWENFPRAWEEGNFARTATNSLILVVATVTCVLTLGGLAAYSLARINPPGTDSVMFYMLVVSTIPIWLYMVPLFFMWRNLGLLNTRLGLVIIYTALNAPFAIFLLRTFLLSIPSELEDAAMVDGANRFQTFRQIILPLSWTGFLTVGLVVALAVWGEYQVALIMIQDSTRFPITTSYNSFNEEFGRDWTLTSAGALMMIFPVLLLFLSLQRQFIAGLTQGSVKA